MRGRLLAGLALVVGGFVLSFHAPLITPIELDLDQSWRLALNEIAAGGPRFGANLAFTYGPLGVLLHPVAGFGFEAPSFAFALAVHLGVWILAAEAWLRWGTTRGLATFAASFLLARGIGFGFGYWVANEGELLLLQCLAAISLALERRSTLRSLKTALLAIAVPVLGLVKLTLAMSGAASLAVSLMVIVARDRREGARQAALGLCVLVVAAGVTAATAFAGVRDATSWLRASLEIAAGYSEAMSYEGSSRELLVGVASVVVFCAMWLAGLGRDRRLALTIAVALPFVFLAFKHGFVRHDIHVRAYFPFLVALAGALCLFQSRGAATLSLAMLAAVAGVGWWMVYQRDEAGSADWARQAISAQPARDALLLLDAAKRDELVHTLERRSAVTLAKARLPESWTRRIGRDRVVVVPWDLGVCEASALNCGYPRTVHTLQAYTEYLDRWTAEGFVGLSAPRFVLARFVEIDGKHPWFGAPATWATITGNYRVVEKDVVGNLFLLERRDAGGSAASRGERGEAIVATDGVRPSSTADRVDVRSAHDPERASAVTERVERDPEGWYGVDRAGDRRVSIVTKLRNAARIRRFLFRSDPVYLELEFVDGRRESYRFLPATASAGLMLGDLPTSASQFDDVLAGRARYPVRRFRIVGPGADQYRVRYVELVGSNG